MTVEGFLDFPGPDLEAGGVNDIFFAVNDVEVAAGVLIGEVAGVEPAAAEGGGGFVGLIPVAAHYLGAAQDEFADFARGEFPGSGVGVNNAGIGIRQGEADGAGFGGVDRVGVGQGRGFGQAVALNQHGTADEGVEGFFDGLGERCGAGAAGAEGGQVVVFDPFSVQQGDIHSGDAEETGSAVILNGLQYPVGGEAAEEDDGGAGGDGDGHNAGDAANVKEGQGGNKDFLSGLVAEPVAELDGVGDQVGVGEHTAFGYPGGAAGVGEEG